ncbi:MAG TPA: sugar transferase [bacterium]|jgi:exopolysaccharide biosynthesis polyprenyl glycosylphosphotransferase|nr:sugar transferase [bacterium]HNZ51502.1 sugar transferase [bacterium]HOF79418.1 sugar transferase [bacterium]HOH85311.1 sugar transferase [bacterium]HOQ91931.1 sugar transferase [bacterium]
MTTKSKLRQLILLLGDWLLLYASLAAALLIRYRHWPEPDLWQQHTAIFNWLFIVWLLIFYVANLYNLNILAKGPRFTERVIKAIVPAGLLSLIIFYLLPAVTIAPKTNLLIFSLIYTGSFLAWRHLWRHSLRKTLPRNNVLLIGYNQMADELWQLLNNAPHLGYKPRLLFTRNDDQSPVGWTVIRQADQLAAAIKDYHINTLVIVDHYRADEQINQILFSLLPLNLTYLTLSSFYEQLTGKVPLAAIGQLWFLENLNLTEKRWYLTAKRGFDVVVATIGLIITAPLWPLIALIIKISSRGPIIFQQQRLGRNNQSFTIYKFRTMKITGNDFQPTGDNDQRITAGGRWLRQTRLDEIPQLINIIKGDMSFIGPRPERPELIANLTKELPFYHVRGLIRPGITGWDQVSGEYHSPSLEDTYKKLQHDLFYLKNCSIYLDLTIILKTLTTVLSREGK